MKERVVVAVEVPLLGDERLKNWAKVVESVNSDRSTGWAYEGSFVSPGGVQDLPAPSVLMVYGEKGSRANPRITARVYTVNSDATLSLEAEAQGRAWARTLRDTVERCLGEEGSRLDLSGVSDQTLAEELRARGWEVNRP